MGKTLYDSTGYQVRLESSVAFDSKTIYTEKESHSLSVFITYLGAVEAIHEASYAYENDAYVVTCLDPSNKSINNKKALTGLCFFGKNGVWATEESTINLKEEGITKSGLKFCFNVPEQLNQLGGGLKIYVNDILQKEINFEKAGNQCIIMDVKNLGIRECEYLEQAHNILKILLADFIRVCNKYNLKYYIICGSLLGAVREKDFIPWDDDLDVAMPRADFDILLKHVNEEWGEEKDIIFVNYNQMGNHTFLDFMTRIVYMKEEIPLGLYRKIKGKGRKDIDNHMPMDIYVLDNASDSARMHKIQTGIIQGLYGLAMGHRVRVNFDEYKSRDSRTQKIVKLLVSVGRFIPLPLIFILYEITRQLYKNKKSSYYFESNGFIYCIPWRFEKKWFQEGVELQLGEMLVNAPNHYLEFLKMHYGKNYIKYPPMKMRKPTHSEEASGIF